MCCGIKGKYVMLKENMKRYYTKDIHNALQSFPDKRINMMDRILYNCHRLFFFINKQLRQPNSWLCKMLHK